MANPRTIASSIATLKGKGYTDAEIQAIQFSVPQGDNRRATALFNAARSNPNKNTSNPAPPPAPTPVAQVQAPRKVGETDGDNLKIKKKSRKRRQELSKGTGQLRINPTQSANVSTAGTAAASGGVNT